MTKAEERKWCKEHGLKLKRVPINRHPPCMGCSIYLTEMCWLHEKPPCVRVTKSDEARMYIFVPSDRKATK